MGLRTRLRGTVGAFLKAVEEGGQAARDGAANAIGTFVASAAYNSVEFTKAATDAVREGIRTAKTTEQKRELVNMAKAAGVPIQFASRIEREHPGALQEFAMAKSQGDATGMPSIKGMGDWKAYDEDPMDLTQAWGAWRERASGLSYETLALMTERIPPVTAIVQTRINQVAAYAVPQENPHDMGFRITLRDKEKKANSSDKKMFKELETAVVNCGFTPPFDEEEGEWRNGFEALLRMLTRDSLTYDQLNIEKRRDAKGRPAEWRAIDSATIRHVVHDWRGENERNERVRYAQIMHGAVVADFSALDLGFNIRNPRTNVRAYGYGYSELEQMVTLGTAILNGFTYNAKFFSQGTTSKGLLSIRGIIPPRHLRSFQRLWYSMVSGTQNAWRTPILNIPDEKGEAKWIDLQKSNLDMEWSNFMDWCMKLACAIYAIDPNEINFQFGNTGQSSSLGTGTQQEKFEQSKDKGLKPLLTFLAKVMNENIIWQIAPEYELQFMGMDARTKEQEAELAAKEVKVFRTVDEIRTGHDLKPLPDGKGEVILDPTWYQFAQSKDMAAQQEAMGEGEEADAGGLGNMMDQFGGGDDDNPFGQPPGNGGPPNGAGQPQESMARSQSSVGDSARSPARIGERRQGDTVSWTVDL